MRYKAPEWTKAVMNLPPWAKQVPHKRWSCIRIECDPDVFYPYWLGLLGVDKPDQYWLEVAYQCAKLDVQRALEETKYDPRVAQKPAEIRVLNRPKWALSQYSRGKGTQAASQGKEAREHYKRVRGRVPLAM